MQLPPMTFTPLGNYFKMEKDLIILGAVTAIAYILYKYRGNATIVVPPPANTIPQPPTPPIQTVPEPEPQAPIYPPPVQAGGRWKDFPGLSYPNFYKSEFDSPDAPGSGGNMQVSFMNTLQIARTIAGVSFHINSGYRTQAHNAAVGGVQNSAHTRGYAADIRITAETKTKILNALTQAGFKRIGIGTTFIHADNDPTLPSPATWYY